MNDVKNIFPKRNYIFLAISMIGLLVLIEISIRMQVALMKSFSSLNISEFLRNNLSSYVSFTFAVLPLLLMEMMMPNDVESKDHRHGVLFWIISIQCNYFFSLLSLGIINFFGIGPVFKVSFESIDSNYFFNPIFLNCFLIILSLLIFDFFYYWYHRMQHTTSFFWEFHKTHHSIKNLNSIVSYHHVSEELFRIPFITIPLAILIHIDAPRLAVLSSFLRFTGSLFI
jgi:sterol desaturase/sphingolipid hydroxylase (fatty acid hydroxylase superfamily)